MPSELQSMQKKSVVRLVDDDPGVLRALSVFLGMADWSVRTYGSGRDFLSSPGAEPGCVVLDVRMPGMSGIEVQGEMKKRGLGLPIIFLSAHGDVELAVEAVRNGAKTFLVKPPKPEKLLAAVEEAVADNIARCRDLDYLRRLQGIWETLTPAEKEVAKLVAKGLQNAVIGDVLGISERTVRSHRTHIYEKLDAENAVEVSDFIRELDDLKGKYSSGGAEN
ncbi:MAG: response regulator [Sutterellaceae bacterium]|nr:response regulator [Sutterellaceae bacterium]MDY2867651.1 response regulator [Mesosutterella sp.]